MKLKKTKNKIYKISDSNGNCLVTLDFKPTKKEFLKFIREEGPHSSDEHDEVLLSLYSLDCEYTWTRRKN